MLNPYKLQSVNRKNVCFNKEFNKSYDLIQLVKITNSLNTQLIEANIKVKHLEEENELLKEEIRKLEFKALIK